MKISVLTACFDCQDYIGACIRSVLNQSYPNWEMLILNDHSKDGSKNVIQKYTIKDPRIKLIERDKKLHCGGSYCYLSEQATGDISAVLDADDCLLQNSMLRLISAYERTNADFIWSQFKICNEFMHPLQKGFSKPPDQGKSLLESRHAFSHWRTYRTYMRDRCEVFPAKFKSAVDKWMGYALEEAGQGYFYDKILYLYRRRTGGLSYKGRKNWNKMVKYFRKRRELGYAAPIPIKVLKDV